MCSSGLHIEGESQHSQLTARLVDAQGMLAGLTALGQVPLRELWQAPTKTLGKLTRLAAHRTAHLPRRALDDFPETLRPSGLTGEVEAAGRLTGSLRAPLATLNVRGYNVQPSSASLALPVDLDVKTKYDGEKVETRLYAKRPQGIVLDAVSQIRRLADLLLPKSLGRRPGGRPTVRAPAQLPPGERSRAGRQPSGGPASGTLAFTGINRDPAVNGQVDLQQLTIDKATFPHGVARFARAPRGAVLSAKLDQTTEVHRSPRPRESDGRGAAPELDRAAPLDLYVEAHDFRAAALYPVLFRGIFTYFDGRLDGTLHLHQEKQKAERVQTVDGAFDLKDGVFQIPQIGQEFSQAKAHIAVVKSGEVQIEDVSANGATGRLTASGTMLLKGFAFASAEGAVKVARKGVDSHDVRGSLARPSVGLAAAAREIG